MPYVVQHEQCANSAAIKSLPTNADKDRAFLECHNSWAKLMQDTVAQELEVKARELFL